MKEKNIIKKYEVRFMYDGTYYVKKVSATGEENAKEMALRYKNTNKEYHIFSVKPLYHVIMLDRTKMWKLKKRVLEGRLLMLKKDVEDDLRPYGLDLRVYPKGTLFKAAYLDSIQVHGHLILEDGNLPFALQYGEFTVLKRKVAV